MAECDLCGLQTPNPPLSEKRGEGIYCCPGCREVARSLDELDIDVRSGERSTNVSVESIPADAATAYFSVTGMHCTTCESFLQHRGGEIPGVFVIETNYSLGSAKVHYDPTVHDELSLIETLSGYGYVFDAKTTDDDHGQGQQRRETVQRLIVGGFFTMLIMPWYFFYLYPLYVGFDTGILDLGRTTTVGIFFPLVVIGAMTTIVLLYTGYPLVRGAWVSLRTREPNMDLLVTIAALSAYFYSVIALAAGDTHLYFDVTVMVVMVVTLGRYYESGLRSEVTASLSAVTTARVNEAVRVTETGREPVAVSELRPGDEVLVQPGEHIPLDGHVERGKADVDESLLTGESLPVTKEPGDEAVGGTLVLDETITVTVGPTASSTIDRLATAMWDIQSDSPGVQRFADALATVFVPAVLLLGITVTAWRIFGGDPIGDALLWGLTILLVSCPCAMGLATPLAMSAGLRDGLSAGILVTNKAVFEVVPDIETVILDKTGTVTTGEMHVEDVIGHPDTLSMAAAIERLSDHPVAGAITAANSGVRSDGGMRSDRADQPKHQRTAAETATAFERIPGEGVAGDVEGKQVVVGTPELVMRRVGRIPTDLADAIDRIDAAGGMPVVVGWEGGVTGVIDIRDRERPEWESVLDTFADCEIILLTGDDSGAVDRFRNHSSIDRVFAGVPPDAKTETVHRLAAETTTVMIGDGTNDAPALAAAHLGIAMGSGTADASEAADVVILEDNLNRVTSVFSLAAGARRRIRENIGWALLYNAVALPLAVVGLINPFFAAVAMGVSSLLVVTNSRRSIFD